MNELKIFESDGFGKVRVVIINNDPWFVAKEVAEALGYSKPHNAISQHCRGSLKQGVIDSIGREQETILIPESDVYRLIMRSNLPAAEKFEDLVVKEILPSIRKHGGYISAKADETPEELMARALMIAGETLKRREERILSLETKIELDAPKVEFFEAVADSKDAIDIGTAAKVLGIKGLCRNNLFELLRDESILMNNNQPYQRYVDAGWFRIVEQKFNKPDGSTCINIKTLVYQKGLDGIRKVVSDHIS